MKAILATLCCLVLVPLQIEALSIEERMAEYDGELEDLRAIVRALQVKQNDTEELEARVTDLEESMVEVEEDIVVLQNGFLTLSDDIEDVELVNILQEETINTLEAEIFDNENDIEELVDTTNLLQIQVSEIEDDVLLLNLRVTNLESGGGNVNVTDLTERVEVLENVTSQMSSDISELQTTTEDFEARITELEAQIIEPWTACESSPCENGATCVDVNVDTFVCACRDGYFGVTCSDSFADATFLAALSEESTTDYPAPLVFQREVINPGGHYSADTGKYTVPYDGIYQFMAHAQDNGETLIDFFVDDASANTHDDGYYDNLYRTIVFLQELTAGQTVHVSTTHSCRGTTSVIASYFSGYLISAN